MDHELLSLSSTQAAITFRRCDSALTGPFSQPCCRTFISHPAHFAASGICGGKRRRLWLTEGRAILKA
jgi:hypothetical protein